ncbi:MAG: hypothetical protein CEN91_263 [Candidatus Berkelbacteria bacterium Licking1014_85]|uniref:Uncharacterized protein n=1 Tax=Candidatus Berkelbacteria bacterium Licking1014_85 TaxID=2017148 RepID=A0A554LKZ5_9BACT|nr:MAG: hypothetical protein CEN91_263 [Candidatus Berkelbacteria bacterium Licking1014_85]
MFLYQKKLNNYYILKAFLASLIIVILQIAFNQSNISIYIIFLIIPVLVMIKNETIVFSFILALTYELFNISFVPLGSLTIIILLWTIGFKYIYTKFFMDSMWLARLIIIFGSQFLIIYILNTIFNHYFISQLLFICIVQTILTMMINYIVGKYRHINFLTR